MIDKYRYSLFSMCLTNRLDFGLLHDDEKEKVINEVKPYYDHFVLPLLEKIEQLEIKHEEIISLLNASSNDIFVKEAINKLKKIF